MSASEKTGHQSYDVYAKKADATLRIATAPGAGLPAHLKAKDWSLMAAGSSPVHTDARRDIGVHGYCFFQVTKGK
ncbi:hypothetical protein V1282_005399 [Nitrobacteraceae bacterium AZCC 2146]